MSGRGKASDAQDLRVTLKSDVFAFAVTMWEMASRMHPWHGLGVMAVCAVPPAPICPRMACGGCVRYLLKIDVTMTYKPLHPHAPALSHALGGSSASALLPNTHTHTHKHSLTDKPLTLTRFLRRLRRRSSCRTRGFRMRPSNRCVNAWLPVSRLFHYSHFVQG